MKKKKARRRMFFVGDGGMVEDCMYGCIDWMCGGT